MCKSACACRIANIALNDAMILPYNANPGRMEFSERTGRSSAQRLFLARVTAALRAASRRFRVVAALRPAARRFRVNAPFWPGVSVTLGFVFMVSLSLNGEEPRAKLIEVDVVRMVRPATQREPARLQICHSLRRLGSLLIFSPPV